ncbi:hypothetical protein EDD18DRAFT_1219707 [Armillaria luteobubalina]|uniref:Uncharacterized protein n=1 Tax=Armillaria luteobubalina TaxID=153913 RepID=A0AA39U5E4_9AGAR|nr:hypothetical protein EDD18DRAFT_1219707 [Armillaria luteobubalina]
MPHQLIPTLYLFIITRSLHSANFRRRHLPRQSKVDYGQYKDSGLRWRCFITEANLSFGMECPETSNAISTSSSYGVEYRLPILSDLWVSYSGSWRILIRAPRTMLLLWSRESVRFRSTVVDMEYRLESTTRP